MFYSESGDLQLSLSSVDSQRLSDSVEANATYFSKQNLFYPVVLNLESSASSSISQNSHTLLSIFLSCIVNSRYRWSIRGLSQ